MPQIINPNFKPAEFCRTVWSATLEPGTELEDVLKPSYWTHVAAKLRKGDRIEAIAVDGSSYIELYVRASNKIETFVTLMREVKLGKPKPAAKEVESPDYYVKFAGGAKWRVMRKEGNAILEEGIATKEAANIWLEAYLKDIAA